MTTRNIELSAEFTVSIYLDLYHSFPVPRALDMESYLPDLQPDVWVNPFLRDQRYLGPDPVPLPDLGPFNNRFGPPYGSLKPDTSSPIWKEFDWEAALQKAITELGRSLTSEEQETFLQTGMRPTTDAEKEEIDEAMHERRMLLENDKLVREIFVSTVDYMLEEGVISYSSIGIEKVERVVRFSPPGINPRAGFRLTAKGLNRMGQEISLNGKSIRLIELCRKFAKGRAEDIFEAFTGHNAISILFVGASVLI